MVSNNKPNKSTKKITIKFLKVTGDSPNGPFGGFTALHTQPQITHSDSVTSSVPDGADSVTGVTITTIGGGGNNNNNTITTPTSDTPSTVRSPRLKACHETCCSELAQKMYFGVCVTILVTASWVAASHSIKFLYVSRNTIALLPTTNFMIDLNSHNYNNNNTVLIRNAEKASSTIFNAPFFASWFCTNFTILFFPIYLLGRIMVRKCESPGEIIGDVIRGFRDRGFTAGRLINRCLTFCILWLLTTYVYALSLRALLATDAMALFATNVACVYLLSWVILHEQFVGVRVNFF